MLGLLLLVAGVVPAGQVREGTPDDENVAKARAQAAPRAFDWLPWAPATFERAKAERKLVLIDCAAEWCHWCHVMDETTYRDARVGAWLAAHAITIRVDIDERPDLAERYGEWGWPATILLSPDAQELGKFRGYLPADRLLALVEAVDLQQPLERKTEPPAVPLAQVPRSLRHAVERLDFFYDETQGSWGLRRKVPIGMNVLWELRRGTEASVARAAFTLKKQRALIDPVWGGVYQYSGAAEWTEPHFEKLASYQAANLEAWSRGFLATRDGAHLADARALYRYVTTVLRSPEGTFWVNQDADLERPRADKAVRRRARVLRARRWRAGARSAARGSTRTCTRPPTASSSQRSSPSPRRAVKGSRWRGARRINWPSRTCWRTARSSTRPAARSRGRSSSTTRRRWGWATRGWRRRLVSSGTRR